MTRAIIIAAMLSVSCGGSSSQIEVKGSESETLSLAGDWKGKFTNVDAGRTGTIRFSLALGRHTADGEVIMLPAGLDKEPRPLEVQFVEVDDSGSLTGKIEPYMDPQCQCQVKTEFLGRIQGDTISGTFTTKEVESGREQHGRWSVDRQK